MPKFIDLIKRKFGRLVVVNRLINNQHGSARWLCRCNCGKEIVVLTCHLTSGATQGCGCLRIKHGHSKGYKKSKTYVSWAHMIQRCTNTKNKDYHLYGGRGIKVCPHWMKFENFIDHMGECPEKCSIDRIDNNKGYHKENCRWATPKEQAQNRRNNRILFHDNRTQCIMEWSRETKIPEYTIRQRLKRHWSIHKTLTTQVGKQNTKKK